MFIKLIFFFLISNYVYATPPNEIDQEGFAYSKPWLNLYLYKKAFFSKSGYKSKAKEEKFFFSKEGRESPLKELKSAITAFQDDKKKWGHIEKTSQCAFPARYERVKTHFPYLFKKDQICHDFLNWKKKFNADKISIIYAGAFPNNPASMFGHTILRIHNKTRNDLLDYNIGFQAMINTNDNPVTYTLNGLFGGYPGFYNIKPYYINIGLYNNAESRDLWEYPIDFTQNEIDFFIKHLWEVSLNTGFPYYFLDENCSYFILTLFEAVRPNWILTESLDILVHPIETLKKVITKSSRPSFRPAIKRVLKNKLKKMTRKQKIKFSKAKSDKFEIETTKDILVLDTLLDYFKFKNYKARTRLVQEQKDLMNLALKRRSELNTISSYAKVSSRVSPRDVHAPSKIELGIKNIRKNTFLRGKINWGYHGKNDSDTGYARRSFIDFLSIEFLHGKHTSLIEKVNLLKIYSLENFVSYFPAISWFATASIERDCFSCDEKLKLVPKGGIGFSKIYNHFAFWGLLGFTGNLKLKSHIYYAEIEFGLKKSFNKFIITTTLEIFHRKGINSEIEVSSSYYINKNIAIVFQLEHKSFKHNLNSFMGTKIHF